MQTPMKRFPILCLVLLVAGAFAAPRALAGVDEDAVKKMITAWYAAYASGKDEVRYRTFLADDYLLCEHGELVDLEGDVAMLTKNRGPGFQRKDRFDFKSVTVRGDIAYTIYFLESDIDDDKIKRHRRWLESAVLRRIDGRWRASLLHSTKIVSTDVPR
jgi:ketosteroid isomerase-like protein